MTSQLFLTSRQGSTLIFDFKTWTKQLFLIKHVLTNHSPTYHFMTKKYNYQLIILDKNIWTNQPLLTIGIYTNQLFLTKRHGATNHSRHLRKDQFN